MKNHKFALYVLLFFNFIAGAETLSFFEVWSKVSESSPLQEGSRLKTGAAKEADARASRYWLPKIYLDARNYSTDDPGSAFFGILEQRKLESSDFTPDTLNHPDRQTFTRGALGIDLPLFEGGMRSAQHSMAGLNLEAQRFEQYQTDLTQYSQTFLAYGTLMTLQKQKQKLLSLNSEISKLMQSYQLGQKSNPIGYSGLLGMKSFANRLAGLIDQFEARAKAAKAALYEMGIKNKDWVPQISEATDLANQVIPSDGFLDEPSNKTKAEQKAALAAREAAKMDRARYLPRIGAFAETAIFSGERGTANAATAGLYFQWSLFNPSDYGSMKEAKLNALAADRFAAASLQQENAERTGLKAQLEALRQNLKRLSDSDKLLSEQTRVSTTLFRNGSIGALQFVEILNRRTDLIEQQSGAEVALMQTASSLALKTDFKIPQLAGGRK